MKASFFTCFLVQLLVIGLGVANAANQGSGIFNDDGSVKTAVKPTSTTKRDVDPSLTEYARTLREQEITNAMRLRKRMPLKSPTLRHRAVYPRQSGGAGVCSPSFGRTGRIAVYDSTGLIKQGYVRNTYDDQNSYTKGTLADALTVQLPATGSPSSPFEVIATNGPDATYPIVGFVGGSGGYNFKTGQVGFAYMSGTAHTAAGSTPANVGNSIKALGYNAPAESTVWSINCATKQFSAIWVNSDSTTSAAQFFYDLSNDYLGIVGDFNKFTTTYPSEGAVLQTFFFEPL